MRIRSACACRRGSPAGAGLAFTGDYTLNTCAQLDRANRVPFLRLLTAEDSVAISARP